MRRPIISLLSSVPLVIVAGCGPRPIEVPARLAEVAEAPLTPGRGTPSLIVGETTLGVCVSRFGDRGFALIAGDEYAAQLTYLGGQLKLTFALDEVGHDDWPDLKGSVRDPESFVLARPRIARAPLTSLRIRAGTSPEQSFYKGLVDGKFGLFASALDAAGALDTVPEAAGSSRRMQVRTPGMAIVCERDDDEGDDVVPRVVEITVAAPPPATPR